MSKKLNIIFDLDGTLVDSTRPIVRGLQHALRELELPEVAEKELYWCMGLPLTTTFDRLLGEKSSEFMERAVRLYRQRYIDLGVGESELFQGVVDVLRALHKQDRRCFIATVKPTETAKIILKHLNALHFFEGVYGSELNGPNTKQAIITGVLNSHQLEPAKTVMVGDHPADVDGAKANGIEGVAVTYGAKMAHDFDPMHAICPTVNSLAMVLGAS